MKTLNSLVLGTLASFVVAALVSPAHAATKEETIAQAEKAYAERDYNGAGVQRAQESADLYTLLAAHTSDLKEKAKYLVAESRGVYFVGDASQDNNVKIAKHLQGMQAGDQALAAFGISSITAVTPAQVRKLKSTLTADELDLLGEALYERGANLGQWGQANGVMRSLSKWPELKANMQLIVDLGQGRIHEYGAYRVLGRGYYKIPSILGGSMVKAAQYLTTAVNGSLAPGHAYSINGYNTTYYAELLNSTGKTAEAKKMLTDFMSADPNTLNPGSEPETRRAQHDARELLESW